MPTARDVMTAPTARLSADTGAIDAARRLADDGIGSVAVCDSDGRLLGMVSDRDLVVEVLARGRDPRSTKLADLIRGDALSVDVDEPVEAAIHTMATHQVRRVPVTDGGRLVGMISQSDIARACPPEQVGQLVAAIGR